MKCNLKNQMTSSTKHEVENLKKTFEEEIEEYSINNPKDEFLPHVTDKQRKSLTNMLERKACRSSNILKKVHLQNRLKLVDKLTNAINKDKNLYKLDLFGSSLYSCGFVGSDLNLNLKFPSNMQAHEALSHVFQCLQKSTPFENCQSHFDEPEPFIQWIDKETTTTVKIFKNCQNSVYTSRLIWLYLKMYPQLRELSIVFRTWASVCGLDQQKQGSIPSHALVLMCIFYMQRRKLIPILTEGFRLNFFEGHFRKLIPILTEGFRLNFFE